MTLAPPRVVVTCLSYDFGARAGLDQRLRDADRTRGILDVDHGPFVLRLDLDRRMRGRCRRAADKERQIVVETLHLAGDVHHLVERRCDEPGQADHCSTLALRGLEDLLAGHHDAEVDDLEVIALEHDANDVLADVVHVAFDRREHDLAVRTDVAVLLGFDEGHQVADRLLHDTRRLDDLGQEHLAGAEQVADDVHAGHERPFDHVERALRGLPRLLGILDDELVDAIDERVFEAFFHGLVTPGEVLRLRFARRLALVALGNLQQALGRVLAAIEHDVLDRVAQVSGQVFVDRQLPGVDDAHIHAGANRVIQEHRVDRFAHDVVAAERERHVADAAAHERARQRLLDEPRRLDEVEPVARVLLDARGHGEDVRVEDDVLGLEADLVDEDVVGALADLDLALDGVGLALLVEGHDDDGRAVSPYEFSLLDERRLAFLERNRVDDGLALHAAQARFDHRPF